MTETQTIDTPAQEADTPTIDQLAQQLTDIGFADAEGQPQQSQQGPQTLAELMESQNPQLNENGGKMADATGEGVPAELKAMGVTIEDWSKMKGTLTGGSATAIETNLPGEYRELVGRYFQVLAKEAKGKE